VGKYEELIYNCTLSACAIDFTSMRTRNSRTSAGARRFWAMLDDM